MRLSPSLPIASTHRHQRKYADKPIGHARKLAMLARQRVASAVTSFARVQAATRRESPFARFQTGGRASESSDARDCPAAAAAAAAAAPLLWLAGCRRDRPHGNINHPQRTRCPFSFSRPPLHSLSVPVVRHSLFGRSFTATITATTTIIQSFQSLT